MAKTQTPEMLADLEQNVADVLQAHGFEVVEVRPIDYARQLRLSTGDNVNIYTTGKLLPQGRQASAIRDALRDLRIGAPGERPAAAAPDAASHRTTPAQIQALLDAMPHDPAYAPRRNAAWNPDAPAGSIPF